VESTRGTTSQRPRHRKVVQAPHTHSHAHSHSHSHAHSHVQAMVTHGAPPPSPSHVGAAPSAETAAVVTQSARSRGRNRCPHPSPARQMSQHPTPPTQIPQRPGCTCTRHSDTDTHPALCRGWHRGTRRWCTRHKGTVKCVCVWGGGGHTLFKAGCDMREAPTSQSCPPYRQPHAITSWQGPERSCGTARAMQQPRAASLTRGGDRATREEWCRAHGQWQTTE
jgi:hypothetical protein